MPLEPKLTIADIQKIVDELPPPLDPQEIWVHPLTTIGRCRSRWKKLEESNKRNPFGGLLIPVREDIYLAEGIVILWNTKQLKVDAVVDLGAECDAQVEAVRFKARRI